MTKQDFIAKYGIEAYERQLAKCRERSKMYYHTHKEELAEYYRQYYQTNKQEFAKYNKQRYNTPMGRAINLLRAYKQQDRIMNRGEGDLTADWIVENIFNVGKCHYCGQEFSWKELGCDRMDSNLPHTKDNCVPCCPSCNCRKKTTDYDEYKNALAS